MFEVEEVGGSRFVEEGELMLVGEVEGEELLVLGWGSGVGVGGERWRGLFEGLEAGYELFSSLLSILPLLSEVVQIYIHMYI